MYDEFERCGCEMRLEEKRAVRSKNLVCAIGAVQEVIEVVGEVGAGWDIEEGVGMCLVNGKFGRSRTFTGLEIERTSRR